MVLSLLLAACGGGDETATTGTTEEEPAATTAADTASEPTAAPTEGEEDTESEPTMGATETTDDEETESTEEPSGAGTDGEADLGALSGRIEIDGSSTVLPISEAAAQEFKAAGAEKVNVTVASSGTGGGFERFCRGETQISDASRPIKEDEIAACKKAGVEFIELPVALDGLAVMTNPETEFVECLTLAELKKIWQPGAEGKISTWKQVRGAFPEEDIALFGPGEQSGTFDFFTDEVNGEEGASRKDYTASEDDNVLVQGISGEANSLGYFGFSYYAQNQESLKLLGVDGGDGKCVKPSEKTVNDGTYSLSRPLFIYVNAEDAEKQPEVGAFVNFYLSEEFTPVVASPEVGYVELTSEQYQGVRQRFEERTMGTEIKEGEFNIEDYAGN